MNLQSRILTIVGVAILVMLLGLFLIYEVRQTRQVADSNIMVLDLEAKVWRMVVEEKLQRMHDIIQRHFSKQQPLPNALKAEFEIVTSDLKVQANSSNTVTPESIPLMASWILRRVLQDETPFIGLTTMSNGEMAVVSVSSFGAMAPGAEKNAKRLLSIALPIKEFLGDIEKEMSVQPVLLDHLGNFIGGNVELGALSLAFLNSAPRRAFKQHVEHKARSYDGSVFPLLDVGGGPLGHLILFRNDTMEAKRNALYNKGLVFGALLFIGVLLLSLYGYIRHNFSRLYALIKVLKRLAEGEQVFYDIKGGTDEIGQLGEAVERFRSNLMRLAVEDRKRIRLQNRQQRFIRTRMEELANRIGGPFAESLMAKLAEIEKQYAIQNNHATDHHDRAQRGELGILADGFSHMSSRVADQYDELTNLVEELKEALKGKQKLAALEQELDIARQIQTSVLPADLIETNIVEICGTMKAAKEVGGDFYDFFKIDEERIGVVIADVSGKGVPAAFFMLITRTLLKAIAMFGLGPAEVMRKLNDHLSVENDQMFFVTMIYGELNIRTGAFHYANAGHNPAYILNDGGCQPVHMPEGMALAVMEGVEFEECKIDMVQGDALIFYTDGVTEAFNAYKEPYGEARLAERLSDYYHKETHNIPTDLTQSVYAFAEGTPQSDDITIVGLRYRSDNQQFDTQVGDTQNAVVL